MKLTKRHKRRWNADQDIVDAVARILWDFAYDVGNPQESRFMADHTWGQYMPYVYAALQRYQYLEHGFKKQPDGTWGYEGEEYLWDAWWNSEERGWGFWLKRVSDFLPCLWD